MIAFRCPKCQVLLRYGYDLAGQHLACSSCGQQVQVPHPEHPTHLVIGDLEAPIVECSRYQISDAEQSEDLPKEVFARLSAGLQGFFQMAPTLHAAFAGSGQYLLRFSPEVAKRLADGSATLSHFSSGVVHAMAKGADGKWIGAGRLVKASSSSLLPPLLIWECLAIVTAQYYLSHINTRLANLEKGVAEIEDWLKTEQECKLRGDFRYLRDLARHLPTCDFQEAEVNALATKLEDVEHNGNQVIEHLHRQREQCGKEVESFKLAFEFVETEWLETRAERFKELLRQYHKINAKYLLALQVRGMAAQLRCALLLSRGLAKARLQSLVEQLADLRTELIRFRQLVEGRLSELKGWWKGLFTLWVGSDERDQQAQYGIQQCLFEVANQLDGPAEELQLLNQKLVDVLGQQQLEMSCPVQLLATLSDQGEVVGIQRLRYTPPPSHE